jgi:hypothetical protein
MQVKRLVAAAANVQIIIDHQADLLRIADIHHGQSMTNERRGPTQDAKQSQGTVEAAAGILLSHAKGFARMLDPSQDDEVVEGFGACLRKHKSLSIHDVPLGQSDLGDGRALEDLNLKRSRQHADDPNPLELRLLRFQGLGKRHQINRQQVLARE